MTKRTQDSAQSVAPSVAQSVSQPVSQPISHPLSHPISQKVTFPNGRGHELSGRLELPTDRAPHAYALFAHCFTCGKDLTGAVELTRALTLDGYGVLRFDFTGLGESDGEFEETTFSSTASDIVAAAAFLEQTHQAPQLLIGHSLGGTAVIRAAGRVPSAKAVVTIGAPFDAEHVTRLFGSQLDTIESAGEARVSIAGRAFVLGRDFLHDVRTSRIAECLQSLDKALLVMHAPGDQVVSIHNAAMIYTAARHPKSFISLDDADHLLSHERDAQYAARTVSAWASRFLPEREPPSVEMLLAREDVVARTGSSGFRTEIRTGTHGLVADEPVSVGGGDAGPSPYDLLLAALGACTGMTLRMYADRKKWPLDAVTVHLAHHKIHAADGRAPGDANARTDRIERTLELDGDLTDAQRARLLEIAAMCPVHRTLERSVEVVTRADGQPVANDAPPISSGDDTTPDLPGA